MKNFTLLALCLLFTSFFSYAQETYNDLVKEGDELVIGRPASHSYQFVQVPKLNFIIKRGGIANIKSLENNVVIVKKIKKDKKDNTIVVLTRKNGKRFFNAYSTLKADLNAAINAGELQIKKQGSSRSITK